MVVGAMGVGDGATLRVVGATVVGGGVTRAVVGAVDVAVMGARGNAVGAIKVALGANTRSIGVMEFALGANCRLGAGGVPVLMGGVGGFVGARVRSTSIAPTLGRVWSGARGGSAGFPSIGIKPSRRAANVGRSSGPGAAMRAEQSCFYWALSLWSRP